MFADRLRNVTTVVLSLFLVLATPVVTGAQEETSDEPTDRSRAEITAQVINNHWLDIRVYAVADGRTHRLGLVTSYTNDEFKLPSWFADASHNTQLVAYPVGSRSRVATPILLLVPGDIIEWRVENNLRLSNVAVFTTG